MNMIVMPRTRNSKAERKTEQAWTLLQPSVHAILVRYLKEHHTTMGEFVRIAIMRRLHEEGELSADELSKVLLG